MQPEYSNNYHLLPKLLRVQNSHAAMIERSLQNVSASSHQRLLNIAKETGRVTWTGRNPLAGNAGGGRWSPDGRFEVLYTSLNADGAMAEVYYHLSHAPVMSSSHMRLNRLKISLDNVLVLDAAQLKALGVDDPLASRLDNDHTQAVGEATYIMDYQGLIVPSARWVCSNLVLFIERIDLNEHIELLEQPDVNWPAWREKS